MRKPAASSRFHAVARWRPIKIARGGNTGRIYGINLESEAEKNRKIALAQINRNSTSSCWWRRLQVNARLRFIAWSKNALQGNNPNNKTGMKNHGGS